MNRVEKTDIEIAKELEYQCPEWVGGERCEFVAKGATEADVFLMICDHFKIAHNLSPATKSLRHVIHWEVEKVRWSLKYKC